jgi:hypothetical protein
MDVLALYHWKTGQCFRRLRTELDTTSLKKIDTPIGDCYDVASAATASSTSRANVSGTSSRPVANTSRGSSAASALATNVRRVVTRWSMLAVLGLWASFSMAT